MQERNHLASQTEGLVKLETDVADAVELIELGEAEGDVGVVADAISALRAYAAEAKRREIESLLAGEADGYDSFLEIHAGAGGTEAQDWAEMLMRMYSRWAERHGCKVEMMEASEGEQVGLKSVTLQISGPSAYGWLKTEAGVHRLVRKSVPSTPATRRHTSFRERPCSSLPWIDDDIDIEINPMRT